MIKRKIKSLIVVYSILLVGLSILPFVFSSYFTSHEKDFQRSFDIAKTIAILTGSYLAINYFDPHGIRKKRIEKQYENIAEILEILFGRKMNFISQQGEHTIFSYEFINKKTIQQALYDSTFSLKNCLDIEMVFEKIGYTNFSENLQAISNSIFTPKIIVTSLNTIIYVNGDIKPIKQIEENMDFVSLSFKPIENRNEEFITYMNYEVISLRTFFKSLEVIINDCKSWLIKNSFSLDELNL